MLNHQWTEEEKQTLYAAVSFYGTKWVLIKEQYFPTCSIGQVRQKYVALKKAETLCQKVIQDAIAGHTTINSDSVRYVFDTFSRMLEYLNKASGLLGTTDIMETCVMQRIDQKINLKLKFEPD